ncbi:hypothetical protein [Pantoea agglomerans]
MLFLWAACAAIDVWHAQANHKVRYATHARYVICSLTLLIASIRMFAS